MAVKVGTSGFSAKQVDPLAGTRDMVVINTTYTLPQMDGGDSPPTNLHIDGQSGVWNAGTPSADFTPAADPHVQQLAQENATLRAERDQLASINARLSRKPATLRDGVQVLAERIKERE